MHRNIKNISCSQGLWRVLPGTGESGEWGMTINGYRVSFGGDESILEL